MSANCVYRRIPLENIPEDEAECAAWLHQLYQEKVSPVVYVEMLIHKAVMEKRVLEKQAVTIYKTFSRAGS